MNRGYRVRKDGEGEGVGSLKGWSKNQGRSFKKEPVTNSVKY